MDKRIAIIAAIGFTVAGAALLVKVNQPLYGVSSLLAATACIGYLLLQGRSSLLVSPSDTATLYDLGWLAAWGTAIAVYALRPEPYERPLAFFVFIAVSCGFVAAKAIRCLLPDRDVAITLAQTIVIGLSLVWTVTLMYPSLIGLDPWTHRAIVLEGIDAGSWSAFPLWHRAWYGFTATVMQATGLGYRLATMAASFIQVAGGVSLVFLLGKRAAGTRVGLLAALVTAFSSWHIFFGYWIIPNGLGLTLVLLGMYLVVRYSDTGGKWPICAFAVTLTLLLFTYPMAVTWLVALLGIWVVLTLVKGHRLMPKRYRLALPIAGIGVLTGILGKVGFLHHIYDLVFLYRLSPGRTGSTSPPGLAPEPTEVIPSTPTTPVAPPEVMPPPETAPPPAVAPLPTPEVPAQAGPLFLDTIAQLSWEFTFNSLGMILGFAIAVAGCLWLISKYHRSTPSLFIVLAFGMFLMIGIIPALFGMSVIEHRWWYAAQAFGAIPIAVVGIALHKWGKGVVVTAGVIALSFLMMIGLPCNMDNYTFSENQLARYALTQGELDAVEWALDECNGDIGVDNYYTVAANMLPESDHKLVGINKEILASDYGSLECGTVLIRDAIVHDPFALGEGRVYRLLYDPNTALAAAGYELAYSAGGVNGYTRGGTVCA